MRRIKFFSSLIVLSLLLDGLLASAQAQSTVLTAKQVAAREAFAKAENGDTKSQYVAAYLILVDRYSDTSIPALKDKTQAENLAVKFLEQAAAAGDAPAEHLLGTLYFAGIGVPRNAVRASELFEKAAEAGNSDAENALGEMLQSGNLGKPDYAGAVGWFEKAAAQGHVQAIANLGYMYANGRGVAQDSAKALELTRKAADAGVPAAQHNLGWMYANGKGVEKDSKEAVRWYLRAADQGYGASQLNVGFIFAQGEAGGDVRGQLVDAVKWFALASSSPDKSISETAKKAVAYVAQRQTPDILTAGMDQAKKWTYNH